MKTNKTSKTICIFDAFDMETFFDKEGLIDTLHTMLTKGKISMSDYRMWFKLNNRTRISILTPLTINHIDMELNSLIFQDDIAKMNFTLEDARKGAKDVVRMLESKQLCADTSKSKFVITAH